MGDSSYGPPAVYLLESANLPSVGKLGTCARRSVNTARCSFAASSSEREATIQVNARACKAKGRKSQASARILDVELLALELHVTIDDANNLLEVLHRQRQSPFLRIGEYEVTT